MKKLALAISITARVFRRTLDKGGQPYILHCINVMNNTRGDECIKCAAVMHDVVEDTEYTIAALREFGFSEKTLRLIDLLTHNPEDDYMTYIRKIGTNKEATEIKLRDLEHNSCITRLKGLTKKDFDKMQQYHTAYVYLSKL